MEEENTCKCGNWKKEEYEECFECARETAQAEDRICECGQFKSPDYPTCYDCKDD